MSRKLMKSVCLALLGLLLTCCGKTTRDACDGVTCSGHGRCEMQSRQPLCVCDQGYAGTECDSCALGYHDDGSGACVEDSQDLCQPYTCSWHGQCDDSTGVAVCTCDPGYTGDFCMTCAQGYHPDGNGNCLPDDECQPGYCSGHGTCLIVGGVPVCECDPDYSGETCQNRRCQENQDCSDLADSFCAKLPGNCQGTGICRSMPNGCFGEEDPVCGCDGQTYPNECYAHSAGVSIDYHGECQQTNQCQDNQECLNDDSYCAKIPGACDGQGECKPRPPGCPEVWDPVCGCDGLTYDNACMAAADGVNVDYEDICDPITNDCQRNEDCGNDFSRYCAKDVGKCQGPGTCEDRPVDCTGEVDPVCGCDGITYVNACTAASARVNVDYQGECEQIACHANSDCDPAMNEYCAKPPGDCGGPGQCLQRPFDCPPMPEPVCGCNRMTYDNECLAAAAGVNVEHEGPCDAQTCSSNSDCLTSTDSEYCAKAPGDCGGLGACVERPEMCPPLWEPVCGCDGHTYANLCSAAQAGVNVDAMGECEQPGCQSNADCDSASNDYCAKLLGDCDGTGECLPRPVNCPDIWNPVCACDGLTYDNECYAAAAGVNVKSRGVCQPPPCYNNHECTGSGTGPTYCANDLGDCNGQGICLPRPGLCPDVVDPVCGCDDLDYPNPCEAAMAGVNVQYFGPCQQVVIHCTEEQACPDAAMYCATRDGECIMQGICAYLPSTCVDIYNPMCGCNGVTYFNRCEAAREGVSVFYPGDC